MPAAIRRTKKELRDAFGLPDFDLVGVDLLRQNVEETLLLQTDTDHESEG
jgi:hypothetical protein